jgi:polyol transport system substrate-binding protein
MYGKRVLFLALLAALILAAGSAGLFAQAVQINVASVNNPDMVIMKALATEFEQTHPNIKINIIVLPDEDLRQKVTMDASNKSGQYDLATIGPFEIQAVYGNNGWLEPLDPLFGANPAIAAKYDLKDLIGSIKDAVSIKGTMYALPFYGESSMLFYRKDLFAAKGLKMPDHPSWTEVQDFAKRLNDPANGFYGIVLSGAVSYGQIGPLLSLINAFGARWFDMNWQPQFTSPEFVKAITFYVNMLKNYGPPGEQNIGFNEGFGMMAQGKAAMWYHATVAAGFYEDPANSKVVGKIGYAAAPHEVVDKGGWLYTWALAMLSGSQHKQQAFEFMTWATSKDYIKLVGQKYGWPKIPSGTRYSTYKLPDYQKVAKWGDITMKSIEAADFNHPTRDPVPYTGIVQVNIPEFASFAAIFAQDISAMLAGSTTVEAGLQDVQSKTVSIMKDAGYIK